MAVYLKPTSEIITELNLEPKGKVHKFLTNTCAKHNDKYVPFLNGDLARTVILDGVPTDNVESDRYTYSQPYAHYVYEGLSINGKKMNYTKEFHPEASPYWDKQMVSAEMDDILDEVQKYIGGRK